MPGSLKTEAIVLRGIRYGEADRILHLYTPDRGRVGAIAKGVRRARSRFGGRLEPFFRLSLVLYEGRSDLLTVTSAETVAAHPRLREHAASLDVAARACDAVGRLFGDGDPHPGVYHLLANELELLDRDPGQATHANALAFRLKLLLAAGFAPQLAACASCGEGDHLVGFSGAAGGVVCGACEASAFPLSQEAHDFLVGALGRPLAATPAAPPPALAQAERAIAETLEHHAGVRLRAAR
jgi:DNA repair protein RecO (recombination protein O)